MRRPSSRPRPRTRAIPMQASPADIAATLPGAPPSASSSGGASPGSSLLVAWKARIPTWNSSPSVKVSSVSAPIPASRNACASPTPAMAVLSPSIATAAAILACRWIDSFVGWTAPDRLRRTCVVHQSAIQAMATATASKRRHDPRRSMPSRTALSIALPGLVDLVNGSFGGLRP